MGGSPTGAWSGYAGKIAYCVDGAWRFYTPFDGMRAWDAGSGAFIIYQSGSWSAFNPTLSAAEVSVASAATCDIGAAASLCVAITGTTTITSLGTGVNALRFVRFTGAVLLTHNATSLVSPTGANIQAVAGDCCIARSDAGGNWRIVSYQPAGGVLSANAGPVSVSNSSGTVITSLSIPPGKWRLSGLVQFNGSSSSNTFTEAEISTTSGGFTGIRGLSQILIANNTVSQVGIGTFAAIDVTLGATTTYYLSAKNNGASDNCYGTLRAERIF